MVKLTEGKRLLNVSGVSADISFYVCKFSIRSLKGEFHHSKTFFFLFDDFVGNSLLWFPFMILLATFNLKVL